MDYKTISADDHLDLQYLPPDLWTARLPKSLRDRAPHVEGRDGSAVWVCDSGTWGRWAGTPRPKGPKAAFNAFDRGGVDESEMRPAKAELRLADMDRDGVEAQVMYGPVSSMHVADPVLRTACLKFYGEGHLLWRPTIRIPTVPGRTLDESSRSRWPTSHPRCAGS